MDRNDSGLFYVDKKNNTTRRFINDPKQPESISNNFVWVVSKGSANRLWVGTVGGGLNLFNPEKQNFTSYKHDPKNNRSLIRNEVFGLYEDEQSNLWIGTPTGLDKMNIEKGEFEHCKHILRILYLFQKIL
jgi:ligand-binding sensor domain-containing protein